MNTPHPLARAVADALGPAIVRAVRPGTDADGELYPTVVTRFARPDGEPVTFYVDPDHVEGPRATDCGATVALLDDRLGYLPDDEAIATATRGTAVGCYLGELSVPLDDVRPGEDAAALLGVMLTVAGLLLPRPRQGRRRTRTEDKRRRRLPNRRANRTTRRSSSGNGG